MQPNISEFSYGYAVTQELVSKFKAKVIGAPTFPSLYEEGKKGGYDVSIPIKGRPVFLQFKLSEYLHRKNAKEIINGTFGSPYYRMHLRPLKHSAQHNLLLELEKSGEKVFYIAPEFHLPSELNIIYLKNEVILNSAAFTPLNIGNLPDNNEHYIVFQKSSTYGYLCSEKPELISKTLLNNGFKFLFPESNVQTNQPNQPNEIYEISELTFQKINNNMLMILKRFAFDIDKRIQSSEEFEGFKNIISSIEQVIEQREPMEVSAYLGRTFFDAELIVIPQ